MMNADKNGCEYERSRRPYYADPTANTAIANIMREERHNRKVQEMKRKKSLLKRFRSELSLAKKWNEDSITIERLTVEDLELFVSALRTYRR